MIWWKIYTCTSIVVIKCMYTCISSTKLTVLLTWGNLIDIDASCCSHTIENSLYYLTCACMQLLNQAGLMKDMYMYEKNFQYIVHGQASTCS